MLYSLVFPCCIVLHYINNTAGDLIRSHTSYKYCLPQIYFQVDLSFKSASLLLIQGSQFNNQKIILDFLLSPFPICSFFSVPYLLMTPFIQLCKNQNGDGDTFGFIFFPPRSVLYYYYLQ